MGAQCSTCNNCQKDKNEQVNEVLLVFTIFQQFFKSQHIMSQNKDETKQKKQNEQVVSLFRNIIKKLPKVGISQSYNNENDVKQEVKKEPKSQTKPKSKKPLTKEEKHATVIQKHWRGHKARGNVDKLKSEKPNIKEKDKKQSSQQNIPHNKYFEQDKDKPKNESIKLQFETIKIVQNQGQQKREKRPAYTFRSGAVYDGEWLGNHRDGLGIQKWQDGARYEGQWSQNKACGKGKFFHVDGDIFEGEWVEDKANGYGVYTHVNGAKYEGYWRDDLQHGTGIEICNLKTVQQDVLNQGVDNSRFEGMYANGQKHGKGRYEWSDGSFYDGEWVENRITGIGEYYWADGRGYKGQWLNNNMHGKGVYVWKDGRKYEGEYFNDKKHGFGVYIWADGRKYVGDWKNGKQHGKAKYYLVDGTFKVGQWDNGKRLKWLTEEEIAMYNAEQKNQKN